MRVVDDDKWSLTGITLMKWCDSRNTFIYSTHFLGALSLHFTAYEGMTSRHYKICLTVSASMILLLVGGKDIY